MTNPTTSDAITEEPPETVLLSGRAVADLVELLDHCYEFFLDDDRALNHLREYCQSQPTDVTALAVIDQLAWHALLLRIQLAEQAAEDRHRG
ncbi:hypothetical protein MLP_49550 [Microlunatus phosphovorus NM-1]|uniref:Uncharacterized protein n=1 Tax=Microlunatus phosphovorus (strain ATCC 700054 / DSM 10555 / JCM 9379 / NBRC 101784 / NCIMB 13414 / VKM Ac-1990 / NM-1) TaxID=1032480 RepID=F5XG35_MICPN|nr:hypothetical protein [Microlunatus phosphovorus]BAK37969.1 hypothetical protein MLP_49550 [Microlunatus phosphovorus NM-1]